MGAQAATLMLARIAQPRGLVEANLLPPELVVRGSTAPPPAP